MQKPRLPGALATGALILGLALPGLVSPDRASAQGETMVLVGGMLLDGYETPPIHHAAVVIEDNRIVAVGPATEVEIPAGAEIISTEGMTMLPGLVDLHVHLMILGHGEYSEWWPSGSPESNIPTGNRLTVYRTARSAFPAVGLDLAGPSRQSGETGVNRRDSRAGRTGLSNRVREPLWSHHIRRSPKLDFRSPRFHLWWVRRRPRDVATGLIPPDSVSREGMS